MQFHVRHLGQSLMGGVVICACVAVGAAGEREKSTASQSSARFQSLALKQFDSDHNGGLDAAEKTAMNQALSANGGAITATSEVRAQALKQFDANGNGTLGRDEIRAAVRSISSTPATLSLNASQIQTTGASTSRQGLAAAQSRRGSFLQRFDANGDGVLDQSEMAAAESVLSQMMQQGQSGSRGAGMAFATGLGGNGNGLNAIRPGSGNPFTAEGASACMGDGTETGTTAGTTTASNANSSSGVSRNFGGQRSGGLSGGLGRAAGGRGFGGGAIGGRRGR